MGPSTPCHWDTKSGDAQDECEHDRVGDVQVLPKAGWFETLNVFMHKVVGFGHQYAEHPDSKRQTTGVQEFLVNCRLGLFGPVRLIADHATQVLPVLFPRKPARCGAASKAPSLNTGHVCPG